MTIRLIILVVLAGILAVAFATKSSAPVEESSDPIMESQENSAEIQEVRARQNLIWEQDIGGEEPPERAEFDVRVEVDRSQGKNRLYLYITERHGYYADTFELDIWYKRNPEDGPEKSPLILSHYINKYMLANQTLRDCLEVVPAELSRVGGDIGDSENWEAEVVRYHRARLHNPDRLPAVDTYERCN